MFTTHFILACCAVLDFTAKGRKYITVRHNTLILAVMLPSVILPQLHLLIRLSCHFGRDYESAVWGSWRHGWRIYQSHIEYGTAPHIGHTRLKLPGCSLKETSTLKWSAAHECNTDTLFSHFLSAPRWSWGRGWGTAKGSSCSQPSILSKPPPTHYPPPLPARGGFKVWICCSRHEQVWKVQNVLFRDMTVYHHT